MLWWFMLLFGWNVIYRTEKYRYMENSRTGKRIARQKFETKYHYELVNWRWVAGIQKEWKHEDAPSLFEAYPINKHGNPLYEM